MNTRQKQLVRFALILMSAIGCLILIQPAYANEPEYNGKPLSEWLLKYAAREDSSEEAIRQIGTNAIPTLLDLLSATDSNKRRIVSKLKSPAFRQEFSSKQVPAENVRTLAVDAFKLLGTNADPAIPQIVNLLHKDECCQQAAFTLAGIGPQGFAALTNAANDPDLMGLVVLAITGMKVSDVQLVTQLLVSALGSTNYIIQGNAAYALAGKDATLAVPALMPLLDESEYYPRFNAAFALGSFGPAAKCAVPKLWSIFTNIVAGPDEDLARNLGKPVLVALNGIDSEVAKEAEAFLVNSGPLNYARESYTRTMLTNGMELIVGGCVHTGIPVVSNRYLTSSELLDPKTRKWAETGSINVARCGHMAILLPNGKVLVAGGSDGKGNDLTSAEIYDPTTGQWMITGLMHNPHPNERMALQPNGKILVYGAGVDGYPPLGHELYDPTTGTWAAISKDHEQSRAWRSVNQK